MKKVRGYNFSRPFMGERVPQHVQNIVIKDSVVMGNVSNIQTVSDESE